MSVRIEREESNVIVVHLSGKVSASEWLEGQGKVSTNLDTMQSAGILAIAKDFEGWTPGGDWEDTSFQRAHDHQIERLAIVADKQWEDLALMFVGKGFRKFEIQY